MPADRARARRIFVPARGQYDNIGDIMLRRQLLDWLRPNGPLHVYLGRSPDGYEEGLALHPGDVRYRSFLSWYAAAIGSALRGKASYVFKPGEIQLTLVGMKEHLSMLPVLALVRARRGVVARVGVGSRNFAPGPRALMGPSIALSDISLWRDAPTREYLGRGELMPDLAFVGAGTAVDRDGGRDVLVVSMRSDRPYPSDAWLDAVRSTAERNGLEIWTVTQVLRDEPKAVQLAADLGGQVLRWDGTAHHLQEERLRALYRRSVMAVSDRLHVLVAALTEGAAPAALLVDESDKIDRHFAAAGIHGVSIRSAERSAQELGDWLQAMVERRAPILDLLHTAQAQLLETRTRVNQVLGRSG